MHGATGSTADPLLEPIGNSGAAIHVSEDLWTPRDVELELDDSEVIGVVGPNGSGRSTLLKTRGRITEPTDGRVEVRARVVSLLEVGTGSHPEPTGRENIQLNCVISGMTRAAMKSKFDEIVEFSEIGRFLATLVKRYSSDTHVHLAFSVAPHLESDVLAVDGVLAVGDAAPQNWSHVHIGVPGIMGRRSPPPAGMAR